MQKSNWREEIELNEFVGPLINTATRVGATVDAINKVRKNPLVQKGFKAIKNKAADFIFSFFIFGYLSNHNSLNSFTHPLFSFAEP